MSSFSPQRCRWAALAIVAATVATGCADQATAVRRPALTSASRPGFNVINATPGTLQVCPQGPAGSYGYSVSVSIQSTYTINGVTSTFPQSVLDFAAANQTLDLGANPTLTVPALNSNCVQLFHVTAPANYQPPGTGYYLDPVRIVTITQTSAPPGTQLDSIIATEEDQPDVKYTSPTTTVVVDPNGYHGSVASFWNSTPPLVCDLSSIGSNFNGTAIKGGNYIWFNSIFKPTGVPSSGATIYFHDGSIQFAANGTSYNLAVPNATITYSASATSASTTFDVGTNTWLTTVPTSYSGNVFLSGLSYQVPVDLPGGINPVTWSGEFNATASGISASWKWAAAVYANFSSDENALGVKPIDGGALNPYTNSDHAGTAENYKQVVGGARGGAGSNFTGSYSGTKTAGVCH